jgi:flagellar protein FliS
MLPRTAAPAQAAGRYTGDSVATASPARLLVMLYDRLSVDLARGERALREGNLDVSSAAVGHAQDIVTELLSSLDQDAWDGGPALAAVYTFVLTELSTAVLHRDADKVLACRELVEPLREAWTLAAMTQTAPSLAGAVG